MCCNVCIVKLTRNKTEKLKLRTELGEGLIIQSIAIPIRSVGDVRADLSLGKLRGALAL